MVEGTYVTARTASFPRKTVQGVVTDTGNGSGIIQVAVRTRSGRTTYSCNIHSAARTPVPAREAEFVAEVLEELSL